MPVWLLSPKLWGAIALCAALAGVYYEGGEAPRAEIRTWEAKDAARLQAEAVQALHDVKNKERTDAENTRRTAALERELTRLREQPEFTPTEAPPSSSCPPDQVCYDRAEFTRATREHREEVREIVGEGAKIAEDLQSAQDWASEE